MITSLTCHKLAILCVAKLKESDHDKRELTIVAASYVACSYATTEVETQDADHPDVQIRSLVSTPGGV